MRKLKKYKPTRFMAKTSHYDKDAADYAVMFIESLCHTKGTWAGKPFELIDWQEQIIRDIFGLETHYYYRDGMMTGDPCVKIGPGNNLTFIEHDVSYTELPL